MASVRIIGETRDHVTVSGPRAEVKRWIYVRGIELGAERHPLESCSGGIGHEDTARVVGHDLRRHDGAYAGLVIYEFDGTAAATVRRDALAA